MSKVERIAFFGFGNHASKNVIDPIRNNTFLKLIAIYVRDVTKYQFLYPNHKDLFRSEIEFFFNPDEIDILYVLSPISTHYEVALRALNSGIHVWCEKPLTDSYVKTQHLFATAARAGRFLGEVVAYRYHRQYNVVENLISANRSEQIRLLSSTASFCIPSLEPTNIRYNAQLSGGALLDVGFYPLSIAADLYGAPINTYAVGYFSDDLGVDLSGSAFLDYGDFTHVAHWAIGSSYHNNMEISFSNSRYHIERTFSKPSNLATNITCYDERNSQAEISTIMPDGQFENMFERFIAIIQSNDRTEIEHMACQSQLRSKLLDTVRGQIFQPKFEIAT